MEVIYIISSQLPGVITNVMNRGLLDLLKEGRKASVTQLWQSAGTLLSTGGEAVEWWAGQDKVSLPSCALENQWPWSPCLDFLLITCVLCRDLLYMSKGLRGCFFIRCFRRTGSLVRQEKSWSLLPWTTCMHYFNHMSWERLFSQEIFDKHLEMWWPFQCHSNCVVPRRALTILNCRSGFCNWK